MKNDIDIKAIKTKVTAFLPKLTKHVSFAAVLLILLVYIFTVWRISQLSTAEPSAGQQDSANTTSVPKVDQQAINQVLQLENNSPQVHSLFNDARNNPFGE